MTTKDKKRILETPTVRGEIGIRTDAGNFFKYPFRDITEGRRLSKTTCVMISRYKHNEDKEYISVRPNHVEIWNIGYGGGELKQNIPYKNVEILWAHYTTNTNQIN